MASNDLLALLDYQSRELEIGFNKARIQGKSTPQEVSDFREYYFNRFIAKYFPFPHRVTKGNIRDSYDNISDSIDCVVLSPIHPYITDTNEKFNIILADGVDVAIEVKPDISTKSELIRGLTQIQSVKKLRRREGPILFPDYTPKDRVEESRMIPTFIFSMKGKSKINDMFNCINEFNEKNNVSLDEQIDNIVINNVGIITNYKYRKLKLSNGDTLSGLVFEEWKELTLGMFLYKLNTVDHAALSFNSNIIRYYLAGLEPYNIIQY